MCSQSKRSVSVYAVSDTTTESSSHLSSESAEVEIYDVKEQESSHFCLRQLGSDCLFCICATLGCGMIVVLFIMLATIL